MRNIFYFFVIVFTIVTFCACQGACLTFEGGYKDYAGSFTWCQDKQKTVEAGQPVVVDPTGNTGLIVSADDLQVVNDELNKKSNIMSIKSSNPCLEFIQILKRLKKQ